MPDRHSSPKEETDTSDGRDPAKPRKPAVEADSSLKETVRRREEEFRLIVESATDFAIISIDFEGRVTTWNSGAERLLGYEEAEILGRDATMIFTPEDRALGRPQKEMQLALQEGRAEDERWHLRKDGSRFWASGLMMTLKDERGSARGFLKIMRDRTAQRRSDEALRSSEAGLRLAIEAGAMAVWELDLRNDRIVGSAELNQLLGFPLEASPSTEEIRGRYHPADSERIRTAAAEALSRGDRIVKLEFRYLHPDGSTRWLMLRAEVQLDSEGAPARALGVVLDLTERRRAEEALRETERRLDAVLMNTRMAIFLMDERGRCLYANKAAETLTGYSFAELQGRSLNGLIRGKRPARRHDATSENPVDRVFSEHAGMQGEEMFIHKDGSLYPVAFTASPVLDDLGEPVGTVVEARNVAEEKAREAAARESEERFRLVAESAPVMLWMGDPEGKCLYLNKSQREFWGVSPEEVPTFDWNTTIHPGDAQALFEPFAEGMRTRSGFSVEARYRRADGEYRILHSDAQPRFGSGGEFLGMIGVNVDVTETRRAEAAQRRAEEALQALNATLEQRVAEEVAERSRAEEALRHSQKMEAVGQLTGGIAHDFNNMLAVVIGGLNLLQRRLSKGDTDVGRYVEAAMEGASRAATLTQRLLAFSRQQPLSPEPLDANELVSGMSDLLTRALGESIRVETVLAPGLWQTHTDPGQLESAILNLAVNARDSMVDGGKLTIETANVEVDDAYAREFEVEPGEYVLICITDSGSGMSPETISKAFEPFFTTKPVGKGTGLGLSQVFGFVRQSGGSVKIRSEEGHGTTVKMYLPRLRGKAATPASRIVRPVALAGHPREIILVVEDEERVRSFTVEALRDLGYSVVHAAGGPEALRLIESGQDVTLLFTDVVMPDMNGRQLAESAFARLPGLKVLYTTGYTKSAVVHNGTLDPGTNFLPKPFRIDQLAAKVRGVLDGTGGRDRERR